MAAVGVSVGPFASAGARRRLIRVLNRVAYVATRDRASTELLRRVGYPGQLVHAADLVGLLPEVLGSQPSHSSPASGRARLAVTLLGQGAESPNGESAQRDRVIIDGLRSFVAAEPVDVTLFIANTHPQHGDAIPSHRLAAELDGYCDLRTVSLTAGVRAIWREMAACDAGLHVRMHGGIFSYVAGMPFALVPYHNKCDDFLDEVGQPTKLRLPAVPDGPAQVRAVLSRLIDGGARPSLDRADFAERARTNFTQAPWFAR